MLVHVRAFTVLIYSLTASRGWAAECRLFHPLSNEALSESYYYQLVVALLLPISGCMKQIISLSSVISSQVFMKRGMCSQRCASAVTVKARRRICGVSVLFLHGVLLFPPKKKRVWSHCGGGVCCCHCCVRSEWINKAISISRPVFWNF